MARQGSGVAVGGQPAVAYSGMLDCLWRVARDEGVVKGLYRGAWRLFSRVPRPLVRSRQASPLSAAVRDRAGTAPSLLKAALSAATLFGSYDAASALLLRYGPESLSAERG